MTTPSDNIDTPSDDTLTPDDFEEAAKATAHKSIAMLRAAGFTDEESALVGRLSVIIIVSLTATLETVPGGFDSRIAEAVLADALLCFQGARAALAAREADPRRGE